MTEREEIVRKWLSRVQSAYKKATALEMLAEKCRIRAEGIREMNRKVGATPKVKANRAEEAVTKLLEVREEYENQMQELLGTLDETAKVISLVQNDEIEAILIHRYLLFHTIAETADYNCCDSRTVNRKISKGIEILSQKPLDIFEET